MAKGSVTMVGADEAHYLATSKKTSRILSFPDGKDRLITLKNWHWEVFDKLQTEKGWRKKEIENSAYQVAERNHPDRGAEFEKFLREGILYLLKINSAYVMKEDGDWIVSNEGY